MKFDHNQVDKHKLKEMVKNKVLIKSGKMYYTNASKLGELLMEAMLEEVYEFCKFDIQQNWAAKTHQQVRC